MHGEFPWLRSKDRVDRPSDTLADKVDRLESEIVALKGNLLSAENDLRIRKEKIDSGCNVTDIDLDLSEVDGYCRQRRQSSFYNETDVIVVTLLSAKLTHLANMFSAIQQNLISPSRVALMVMVFSDFEKLHVEAYLKLIKPLLPVRTQVYSLERFCAEAKWYRTWDGRKDVRDGATFNLLKIVGVYQSVCLGARSVVALEPDVIFIEPPEVMFDRIKINFKKRKLFATGAEIQLMRDVVLNCTGFFSPYDARRILSRMGDGELYSWFFDVPYYPQQEASSFFAHLSVLHGSVEDAIMKVNSQTYDYSVFSSFLMLHRNFQMIDVRPLISSRNSTDELTTAEIERINLEHDYLPLWASLSSIVGSPTSAQNAGKFVLAMHTERARRND